MPHTNQTRPLRRRLGAGVLVGLAVLSLTATVPAGATPTATAARTCTPPKYPGLGYFTSLTVSGTSCSAGGKLAVAYYRCRLRHGAAGTCHSPVLGYTCHEVRRSIPTEIDARVTCRRGHATIVHTYQQDT